MLYFNEQSHVTYIASISYVHATSMLKTLKTTKTRDMMVI